MKRVKLIALLCATAVTAIGCSDFLDVKPAGKLIPGEGDVQSFDNLLNNANTYQYIFYDNNNNCNLVYLTDQMELSDNQAEYAWYNGHPNIDCYFAHIFQLPYANPANQDYFWNWGIYKSVQYFNACIEGVDKVKNAATAKQAAETTAQAVCARAWAYFQGAMVYGPVYKPGQENSAKVLPYRTSSDVASAMENISTQGEVVARAKKEVSDSYNSLPDFPANTRVGKAQASAFLAQIALYERDFAAVAKHANDALTLAIAKKGGIDNLFYDYNKFTWSDPAANTDPTKRVNALILQTQDTDPVSANYNREICFYRTSGTSAGTQGYNSVDHLALYDKDKDLRWYYLYQEYNGYSKKISDKLTVDDGRRILNYQYKVVSSNGYSYAEVLLMRAEGRARTSDLSGAIADLNTLRKYRYKTGTAAFTATTADAVIEEIINERRRELPVGSIKRYLDLKRLCLDTGKPWCKTSITHIVNGRTYTADIDSKTFVVPIKNPVLRYNSHWGIPEDNTPWSNSK